MCVFVPVPLQRHVLVHDGVEDDHGLAPLQHHHVQHADALHTHTHTHTGTSQQASVERKPRLRSKRGGPSRRRDVLWQGGGKGRSGSLCSPTNPVRVLPTCRATH